MKGIVLAGGTGSRLMPLTKVTCARCEKPLRRDCQTNTCQACRKTCVCGHRKDLIAERCRKCNKKDDVTRYIRDRIPWKWSPEERAAAERRVRAGFCKFGCGQPAFFPCDAIIPLHCCEVSAQCPVVAERISSGISSSWASTSDEERVARIEAAATKLRLTRTPEVIEKIVKTRSQSQTWRANLSRSRKRVLQTGRASNLPVPASVISQDACKRIHAIFPDDEVYYESLNYECCFHGGYRPDFTNRTRKLIVDFFGDYWHCNPVIWDPNQYNSTIRMTAREKWQQDAVRRRVLEGCGYTVIIIWESVWKEDPEEVLRTIKERVG